MGQTILVTGGAGFIGSNLIRYILEHRPDDRVINLDGLTYAGNLESLAEFVDEPRHEFVHCDINDGAKLDEIMPRADVVLHLAAESHVDRSIHDPSLFLNTNIIGTQCMLDAAKRHNIKRFVYVSTDEVYGELPLDDKSLLFTESTPLAPNSPYAVSKTGGDMLARAYHHTYGMNIGITRCSNNFGPYQFPEKVIPLFVNNLIEGKKVPLYGDGRNIRDWLHVLDHCEAICRVLDDGKPGEAYNIGGNNERSNLELTKMLIDLCGRDESFIEHVPDRLGHDMRYAIDATKIRDELGWEPTRSAWPEALEATVQWYKDNLEWSDHVRSGEYRRFMDQNYTSQS
ncbi:MAG: dTDP-glucose 4,6-dehydratase [Phycisphaerales bacterium]|nr:dTDP-glucose 4,6-dehydratase [Phycisphaerales bacterium]